MKSQVPAESPDAYVSALTGWRKPIVAALRASALAVDKLEERIKWGHLVYLFNGPVLLVRAEDKRVLFGFWRGQRLRDLDDRLMRGGKYEMATITLLEGDSVNPVAAQSLIRAAVALNKKLGDPTAVSKAPGRRPRT